MSPETADESGTGGLATTVLGVHRLEDPEQQGEILALAHRLPGVQRVWMDGDALCVEHDPSLCSREGIIEALERRGIPLRLGAVLAAETGEPPPAGPGPTMSGPEELGEGDPADALTLIPYGVFVLSVGGQDSLNACTVSWLTQVSFEPPLLVLALDRTSYSHGTLVPGGTFAINFLDRGNISRANRLALPHRLRPRDLAGVPHNRSFRGTPILDEAIAFLECEVRATFEPGGDHTLFVGEVVAGGVRRESAMLTLRESGLKYR